MVVYGAAIAGLFPVALAGLVGIVTTWRGAYFGFLHATAITGLEDMFALDSEDALVALVFSSGPMFQLGQRCHGGKVVNAMREALRAKFWLPGHGYHVGDHGEI